MLCWSRTAIGLRKSAIWSRCSRSKSATICSNELEHSMKKMILLASLVLPLVSAQEYKIAVVGMVHSHVWGPLARMVKGDPAKLVGVSEKNPELVAEAKKIGVADNLFFDDYNKMLDEVKPDIVCAFVE